MAKLDERDNLPLQKPSAMTLLYIVFAVTVVVLFIWGITIASTP